MNKLLIILTLAAILSFVVIFWNNIFILILSLLVTLPISVKRNPSIVKNLAIYFVILSVLLFPINFMLNVGAYGILNSITLSVQPIIRLFSVSMLSVAYTSIVSVEEIVESFSIILPKPVALALTLAFLFIPIMMEEIESVYVAQMLRGLAIAPFHKKVILTIKTFILTSVFLAFSRAIRVAEAIELYY